MDKYLISGGKRLYGEVQIQSAKNSILPIIGASIISGGKTYIENCPRLNDVLVMCEIIRRIGGRAEFNCDTLVIDTEGVNSWILPDDLTGEIRASLFMVGALLGRFGNASMKMPGGCRIGERPIDIHINSLKRLGVNSRVDEYVTFFVKGLKNAEITLDFPSVGATENLMMLAIFCEGVTLIKNCAKEPEVVDLQRYLNLIGARVSGAGTDTVRIDGGKTSFKKEVFITPSPDRIELETFMLMGASVGGELNFKLSDTKNSQKLLKIFKNNACKFTYISDNIYNIRFPKRMCGFGKVITGPYPDFATDTQPQLVACACTANGLTVVEDRVFPKRFSYTDQLKIMGADISVKQNACIVQGGALHGAKVIAGDLRGGASLVLAGLSAEGETEVRGVGIIDRGYYGLEDKLTALGAKIKRVAY